MADFYSTGGGCFDRLSVHTYNGSYRSFGANSPLAVQMQVYRQARAAAADARPMWVTEFGFRTANAPNTVSEGAQDTLTSQQYNKLLTMPDVEAAFVHTVRDAPLPNYASNDDINYGYGWLHQDGTPKPVYSDFTSRAVS